jgi:predicted glycoside hydrolase/deacetylase ChbG (UPF0249 family)
VREHPLTKSLGFDASERVLIVCCDDLGSSASANSAIERALREGVGTTASLMVPCPWARAAAEACRDLDIGVHLTLTSEYPTYRWRSLTGARSLQDPQGYLPQSSQELWAQADLAEVEAECRAQIEQALDWGVDVSHLNGHMDALQLDRHYFGVYMRLALRYRLPVRLRSSTIESAFSTISRTTLQRAGIVSADRLIVPPWGDSAHKPLLKCLEKLKPGAVTEFFLHPVDDGDELQTYDPEYGDLRVADAACLVDERIKASAQGVTLIGFRPLRDLMRGAVSLPAAITAQQPTIADAAP